MEHCTQHRTAPAAAEAVASVKASRVEDETEGMVCCEGLQERTPVTHYVVRRFVQLAREMREAQKIVERLPTQMNKNIAARQTQTFDRILASIVEEDGTLMRMWGVRIVQVTKELQPEPQPVPPAPPGEPKPDQEPKPGPAKRFEL